MISDTIFSSVPKSHFHFSKIASITHALNSLNMRGAFGHYPVHLLEKYIPFKLDKAKVCELQKAGSG